MNRQKSFGIVSYYSLLILIRSSISHLAHTLTVRCEFINGPMFLQDLKANQVQPCLINALCAVSARYSSTEL